jgi:hypothetical protein
LKEVEEIRLVGNFLGDSRSGLLVRTKDERVMIVVEEICEDDEVMHITNYTVERVCNKGGCRKNYHLRLNSRECYEVCPTGLILYE